MAGSVFFPSSDSPPIVDRGGVFGSGGGQGSTFRGYGDDEPRDGPFFGPNTPNSGASPSGDWLGGRARYNDRYGFSAEARGPSHSPPQTLLQRNMSSMAAAQNPQLIASPGQASVATGAALWGGNRMGKTGPPIPPLTTLDDLRDQPRESRTPYQPVSDSSERMHNGESGKFSFRGASGSGYPYGQQDRLDWPPPPQKNGTTGLLTYKATPIPSPPSQLSNDGFSPPVAGVISEPGTLLSAAHRTDVVEPKPQLSKADITPADYWVTVYGFGELTNEILREFEKCGQIDDQINGPGSANWVHIRYKCPYNARRALTKDRMRINSNLMIAVRPMDPLELEASTGNHTSPYAAGPVFAAGPIVSNAGPGASGPSLGSSQNRLAKPADKEIAPLRIQPLASTTNRFAGMFENWFGS